MSTNSVIFGPNGADKEGKVGLDAPRVHPDTATELMAHHLQLAAMYFEAIPDKPEENVREIERIIGKQEPAFIAGKEWLRVIQAYYDKLKEDYE